MFLKLIIVSLIFTSQIFGLLFPIISYSENSGTIYGLFGQQNLERMNDATLLWMFMSQKNGQYGYLKGTNLVVYDTVINTTISGANTAESYYGIGNYQDATSSSIYSDRMSITLDTEYPLNNSWNILLGLKLNKYKENASKNDDHYFEEIDNLGGIIGLQLDTRNKEINSTSGYLNEIKFEAFPHYQIITYDIRSFKQLYTGTLAYKFYSAQTISNTAHLNYYQTVGNYFYLRGYSTNQYTDKHLSYTQLEWRKRLFRYLEVVPFVEYGGIGNSITAIDQWLFSYGFATHIPFKFSSLRIEKAYTSNNEKFYFGFNHVF